MAHFTVRAIMRTDKENKKGSCPISICVTVQGKRAYHTTGISLPEAAWDERRGKVRLGYSDLAPQYNSDIEKQMFNIETKLLADKAAGTLDSRSGKSAAKKGPDFYQFVEGILKDMAAKGQKTTATRYKNNLPSIREFHPGELSLSDIDAAWLKSYESYCRTPRKGRQKIETSDSQNTIWSRFKFLRKVMLVAEEAGIVDQSPIGKGRGRHPMPTWEKVPKEYLTFDELDKLFERMGHEGNTYHDDLVLSFFLIECTSGIRHSDWSRFSTEKLIHNHSLKVRTKKTGEPVYVPIGEGTKLQAVIKHISDRGYIYTETEAASANRSLKDLAKLLGINKRMTTHTGRHTCATLLLEKGFSRESVAEVLGVSMKVVDVYAKMTRQKVRNEFDKLGGL